MDFRPSTESLEKEYSKLVLEYSITAKILTFWCTKNSKPSLGVNILGKSNDFQKLKKRKKIFFYIPIIAQLKMGNLQAIHHRKNFLIYYYRDH